MPSVLDLGVKSLTAMVEQQHRGYDASSLALRLQNRWKYELT